MIENLSALQLFVRVAHAGSFSKAGRELGLSQPSVSRTIALLEEDLGAALFVRTTRLVTLTEAGQAYLTRVELILDAMQEANHAVRGEARLEGTLKLGLTSTFGSRAVIPRIPDFLKLHPGLKVELVMNDQRQDPATDGVDLTFKFGELPDSASLARKVTSIPRVVAASPTFIEEHGAPSTPQDLMRYRIIPGPQGVNGGWKFTKDGEATTVKPTDVMPINVNEGAIAAAVAGLGVMSIAMCVVYPEFDAGRLVPLLPDWDLERIDVYAVYPSGRIAKPAARAFTDFLIADILANPIPELH